MAIAGTTGIAIALALLRHAFVRRAGMWRRIALLRRNVKVAAATTGSASRVAYAYVIQGGPGLLAPSHPVSHRCSYVCTGIMPRQMTCPFVAGPKNCSGHGTCDTSRGRCQCDPSVGATFKYEGLSCSIRGCAFNCTNGACVDGACECNPGFSGVSCDDYICLNGCHASLGRGVCR